MSVGIVALIVIVLLALALLPVKPKQPFVRMGEQLLTTVPARTLRQQHVDEEAIAISSEYRRLADEAWLADLRQKASTALGPPVASVK
jgi:hypothetical protein